MRALLNKTTFSTLAVCAVIVLLAVFAIRHTGNIAAQTEQMYQHPYTVKSAAQTIRTRLMEMRLYLLPLMLEAESAPPDDVYRMLDDWDALQDASFNIIRKYYLGKPEDVAALGTALAAVRRARRQAVQDCADGANKEIIAAYLEERVFPLSNAVDGIVQRIMHSADMRVQEFRAAAEKMRDIMIWGTGLLCLLLICLINFINISERRKNSLLVYRQADTAKSNFLARMSHEMRTPLNAVIGLSELALDKKVSYSEMQTTLEKIHSSGSTLLALINDILDISKIEAGKLELRCTDYSVPSVINDVVTQNILRAGEKPVQFLLDIDAATPARLYGDELRVKQIISNVLSNAFKYTHAGEVQLHMHCERAGDVVWVTVRVSDSGIGIRPEDLDRLFGDYVQLGGTHGHGVSGTGLGLSITKRLVEMMEGQISVTSELGKGSVFTIMFRQQHVCDETIGRQGVESLRGCHDPTGGSDRHVHHASMNLQSAYALVVDDNRTNLDVTRGFLELYGMRVDCASSGQEAIDAVREQKVMYNIVFMDHMMPEMDGIEAVRRIREIDTEYAGTIPIIALTANAVVGNAELFLSRGFQAYVTKPINHEHLDAVLRRFVRGAEREALSGNGPQGPIAGRPGKVRRKRGSRRGAFRGRRVDLRSFAAGMDGLDLLKGLDRFGDEASFGFVLRSYAVNTKAQLQALEDVRADALAAYAVAVHGIKGASRSIYAESIGDQAEALEQAAKNGNIDFVIRNNPHFQTSVRKVIEDIELMLVAMGKANPKPAKDKPDMDVLARLCTACGRYDMDGVDAAVAELETFTYTSDPGLVDWLKEAVNRLDFALITEKITAMINMHDTVGNSDDEHTTENHLR